MTVSAVDDALRPVEGSDRYVPCDTLMLSVGLIPENELSKRADVKLDPVTGGPVVDESMQTSVDGIFACGNVINVFDLVDYVTRSAEVAGRGAARFVLEGRSRKAPVTVSPGRNVRFVVPQVIHDFDGEIDFYFRVEQPERSVRYSVLADGERLSSRKAKMVRPPEMIKSSAGPPPGGIVKDITVEVTPSE